MALQFINTVRPVDRIPVLTQVWEFINGLSMRPRAEVNRSILALGDQQLERVLLDMCDLRDGIKTDRVVRQAINQHSDDNMRLVLQQMLDRSLRASLYLNFTQDRQLNPQYAYTFAKAEENLLIQSQAWATTPWFLNIGGSATVTNNAAVAPDGTTTATSITFLAQFGSPSQSVTTVAGLSYTFSFWAKRISGNTALHINHFDSATGSNTAFTITNDWARYSVTVLGRSGGGFVQFGVQDRNASGFGEILVWGAQLEQRSSVTAYTPTTTRTISNFNPVAQVADQNLPQVTFTRASEATFFGPDGIMRIAANNVARFDHNPVTGESLGLLVEEQRTNLVLRSEDFNTTWTKERSTITVDTAIAPDGALTADKIVEDTATGTHTVYQPVSGLPDSTVHVASFILKAAERTRAVVAIMDKSATTRGMLFNLSAGTVSTFNQNGITDPSLSGIQNLGNGWYRCWVGHSVGTGGSSPRAWTQLTNGTTNSYTGDGTSGLYIWGAQLEAGATPSSYIPTSASQATRNADAASMTGANFSSWYRQDEGTLYAEATPAFNGVNTVAAINDNTNNNAINIFHFGSAQFQVAVGGAAQAGLAFATSSSFKIAGSYKANDFAASMNGGAVQTDTSGTLPTVTQIRMGQLGSGSSSINGHIRTLRYYPARLTNSQLQAITS